MGQTVKTELCPRNIQMAAMVACGVGTGELAREFNMTAPSICRIKSSELFQLEVKRNLANMPDMKSLLRTRLDNVADASLDVLENLMRLDVREDVSLLKIQANHAQELLSKAGFGSTTNVNTEAKIATGNVLTPEEQDLISAQANALKK